MAVKDREFNEHVASIRESKVRRVLHSVRIIFRVLVLAVCVIVTILAVMLYVKYSPIVEQFHDDAVQVVADSTVDTFRLKETSYVYAADGTQLAKLRQDADCEYVSYDELPVDVINAFIAIEDKRFYEHGGVDWLSTAKAAYLLLRNDGITRGGSTITQQLARNVFLNFEQSYERKLREIFIAIELNKKYSKKQILEFYINNINYGNGYSGIGAAARGYFGKDVSDLSYEQIAFLCAIPNNPSYYNPRKNFSNTVKRRNLILREMFNQGYLSEDEYLLAVNSPIELVETKSEFHNYESSYAVKCAVEYMMKMSGFMFQYSWDSMAEYERYEDLYEEQYDVCRAELYTGGYRVKTSLDLKVQKKLQKCVDSVLHEFSDKNDEGVYRVQGAAVVVDNKTGKAVAVVGGRTQKEFGSVFCLNRAYQGYKQPGSAIKPLIVYTPALENGYTPESIVDDTYFEGGPHNSGGRYDGPITLRYAVEQSKNVVAWKLFTELTPQVGISYLQRMQFSKMTPNDYYAPAALGGLYYGVTAEEMAAGYTTLANDGVYREVSCITSFIDSDDMELFKEPESFRVYTKNAARTMTDVLKGVASVGTAKGLVIDSNPEMPVACKTGTTNGQGCGWFCGFTPYYTCAVYVGADESKKIDDLWGSTYPCNIWTSIQSYLNKGKRVKQFKLAGTKVKKNTTVISSSEPADNTKDVNADLRDAASGSSDTSAVPQNAGACSTIEDTGQHDVTDSTAESTVLHDTADSTAEDLADIPDVEDLDDGDDESDVDDSDSAEDGIDTGDTGVRDGSDFTDGDSVSNNGSGFGVDAGSDSINGDSESSGTSTTVEPAS